MHDEKALLFESLNIPLIEIRFCVDEKEEVYQQYQEMTLEDISKDLQSRSKLRKPLREYIEEPYKKMLKQAQDECIKVESEGKQREKELLKLNEQLQSRLTALDWSSSQKKPSDVDSDIIEMLLMRNDDLAEDVERLKGIRHDKVIRGQITRFSLPEIYINDILFFIHPESPMKKELRIELDYVSKNRNSIRFYYVEKDGNRLIFDLKP